MTLIGRSALTHHRRIHDFGNFVDRDRCPLVAIGNHDMANVIEIADQTFSPNQKLLARLLDIGAAGIGVVAFDRLEHVAERDVERRQPCRVESDLVGL